MTDRGDQDNVREAVRDSYARMVTLGSSCCGGSLDRKTGHDESLKLGYTEEDLASVPEGANLGLGCGNPQAIAALKLGEVVVDLGAGAGFDCFLAARAVGPTGKVIGVDMTSEMVQKARENARNSHYDNVEFRLGEIEHLPVADATADVVISNCVINLSPDKPRVFREAFRVLKPGGRFAVTDTVTDEPLPESVRQDMEAWGGCVAGAMEAGEYRAGLVAAGFTDVSIRPREEGHQDSCCQPEDMVYSAMITARKPA